MKKSICILKFGGTSVGNGERIRRVAAIIADTVEQSRTTFPVVIVSAMAGVTDQLLRIARDACSHVARPALRRQTRRHVRLPLPFAL